MLMIRPHRASIMSGTTAWQQSKVPRTLTARTFSNSARSELHELPERRDAHVVDQDGGRAEAVADLGDGRVDGGPISHVDTERHGRPAIGRDLIGHLPCPVEVEVEDGHRPRRRLRGGG